MNTNYRTEYSNEATKDRKNFNDYQLDQIDKAVRKVSKNPLPQNEGGLGKPLGHKFGLNLTGLCKITLKKLGIRVVYKLLRTETTIKIIVIALRADEEVYKIAADRTDRE